MKAKLASFTFGALFTLGTTALGQPVSLESAPPVVVKTEPVAGATQVDPRTSEIVVQFSKQMQDGSWSWSTWGEENYPETTGQPKYASDKKTCILPVKLQPGKFYAIWLNSDKFGNFKDASGQSAVPYLLTFTTAVSTAAAATTAELAPIPKGDELPGKLIFLGRYRHRSRGADNETPSELRVSESPEGLHALVRFGQSTEWASSDRENRFTSYRIRSGPDEQSGYRLDLELRDGLVKATRRGARQDWDGKELKVPAGAWFDPNTRPDSYCAANILLRAFAVREGESKEFRVYDWDNSGEALADYKIQVKNAGKEKIEVPAGTFEANHLVLTQITSADTWFKKRAGHVTDFWVLDNHVIVRVLRHREPYEMVLLDYTVPEKPIPGATSGGSGGLGAGGHRGTGNVPIKTIVMTRATNQMVGTSQDVRTVSVWTDSSLLPGDVLRAIVRTPDGEMRAASSAVFTRWKKAGVSSSTSLSWFFKSPFGEKEAEAAVAQIQENKTERPIHLLNGEALELFAVTNQQGGVMSGYVEFVHSEPSAATEADGAKKVKALVRIRNFTGYFPSLSYSAEVPAGYTLRATASDGEVNTQTPAGPYEYSSTWFQTQSLPGSPAAVRRWPEQRQAQQAAFQTQLQRLQEHGPLEVVPGEPRLLFTITNSPGDVLQGFLELIGPSAVAKQSGIAPDGFLPLLTDDQRAVLAWTDRQFRSYFDTRSFEGKSDDERAALEAKWIEALNGPRSSEYFQAINVLGAMRSAKALPRLREIASERVDRNNRDRWMAIRALGLIGDKQPVPELIHLVYHGNVNTRWWAQISLVRITGQNFAKDWNAWGKWWNDQGGQPPFKPEIIRWWDGQAEPDKLAETLEESDRKFLNGIKPQAAAPKGMEERNQTQTGEQYLQQQLKLAKADNYWAKFNLWEAFAKGKHETAKNAAEADQWLSELVKGAYLARFEPVNGFTPKTPKEMLDKFNEYCRLHSGPDSLGGASFFRTTKQDDKLIGSFLTASPDEFKAGLQNNPSLRLISMEKVTPEMFRAHEAARQESLPAPATSSEVATKLRNATPLMDGIRESWSSAVEAMQRENATSALASLRILAPRIQEFRDLMKGTSLEAGTAESFETLKSLMKALEKGDKDATQTALAAMTALGQKMESQVKTFTDPPGS